MLDRRLIGDRHEDHVAALLGLADGPQRGPIGGLVERREVAMDVPGVRQFARRTDDATVEGEGRRHGGRCRQMVHQLRGDPRILQVFLDLGGVRLVDLLRGRRLAGLRVEDVWNHQRQGGGDRQGAEGRGGLWEPRKG
jgi:hypothetical protein